MGNFRKEAAEHGTQPARKRVYHTAVFADFMMPSHKDRMPVSPSDISNAVLDESNVELTSSVNISVSPINRSLQSATMKAITEKCYPDVI